MDEHWAVDARLYTKHSFINIATGKTFTISIMKYE